ncbi:type II secretion system secretin GspD [Burkholderia sp. WAC0059]|uniref:type II secretion system secretin GspD n=1 Tax=Burkholderia sp. WAC0059 TaxID=2066022 RepID=UPI0021556B95|nr:type II secretion system secretin GspD [Burkholderia sp. WAC0059]
MIRSGIRQIGLVICMTGLAWAHVVQAQVNLNFSNTDISQVARAIGTATNTTIIVDPRVKGQLNLVTDNPVSRELALKTLEAALRMQGFALVRDNGILKVVPEADAKLQGVPTYVGNAPHATGDMVVTQVFRLQSGSANALLPALKPMVSPNNSISVDPSDNALIVTDYADNVRRIADVIAGIDGDSARSMAVIRLEHRNALDVAPVAQKMLDPSGVGNTDAALKVSVTADPGINAILLRASDASRIAVARGLIRELDAPTGVPGNMHVVKLDNARASDLAKVLRGMLGLPDQGGSDTSSSSAQGFNQGNGTGSSYGSGSTGTGTSTSSSTGTSGVPPLPGGSLGSTSGSGSGSGSFSGTSGGAGGLIGSARGGGDEDNPGGITVVADPATNSLVVTAPDAIYESIRNVIGQLDVRRAQVYFEAMIVEMTATQAANLGVQWAGALQSSNGNNALIGTTNFNTSTSQGIVNLTAEGQSLGSNLSSAATTTLLNNGINIGLLHNFGKFFGLGALVQALSTVTNASILSSPNLITLDNEEASLVIGSNVPIQTGSVSTATASTTGLAAYTTYDREDVGIVLHVRPQVTKDGVIKMQIYTEDSSVDATSVNNPGGVTIIKRSVNSTVLADDGEIVVLGGLIQDNYSDGNNKVPWLGNLPVIGSLFRAENKSRTKTNVMVFLRPVVIRDAESQAAVSDDRYNYIRGQMNGTVSDNRVERDQDTPTLPPVPPGPQEGVPAAEGLFDMNQMTRRAVPGAGAAPAGAAPDDHGAMGTARGAGQDAVSGSGPAAPASSQPVPVQAPDAQPLTPQAAPAPIPGLSMGDHP